MSCAREFLTSNREPNNLLSIHQNNPMTPIVLYLEARRRRVRLNDGGRPREFTYVRNRSKEVQDHAV